MKGIEDVSAVHKKVEVEGTCRVRFSPVRDAFTHNVDTGQDIGASVAVFVDGEPVVTSGGRTLRRYLHPTVRTRHDRPGLLVDETITALAR
jgi:hypothetical protein